MITDAENRLFPDADIPENDLLANYPEVLELLLRDRTTGENIFWATDDYQSLGAGYGFHDPIKPELITGRNGHVIMPRVKKDKSLRSARSRDMAEVFTPSWICNIQNNLVDSSWFGRDGVFNTENESGGRHTWTTTPGNIEFPEGKTWMDYVRSARLEMACGEAPYLVSRYDATTGEFIPVKDRIGLFDRKLRVVNENTDSSGAWLDAALIACQSTYGFEWQGDSLLLARETMLCTFIDNHLLKFGKLPTSESIGRIAHVISWNLWQMDGLKFVVPESCHEETPDDLFGGTDSRPCPGCATGNRDRHNGVYCQIMDWQENRSIEFRTLLSNKP